MVVASLSSSAAAPAPASLLLLHPAYGRPWRLLRQSSSSPLSSSVRNPRAVRHHRLPPVLRAAQSPMPEPPPPPEDPISGLQMVLSRILDRVHIFFAVFFWLSLFFWGSIWDGRGNYKKKKGPWSRK